MRIVQGGLLIHIADAKTPIRLAENASRPNERVLAASLADLAQYHKASAFEGPLLSLYGLPLQTAISALQRTWRNGPAIYRKSRYHQ